MAMLSETFRKRSASRFARSKRLARIDYKWGYLMVAPLLAGLAVFFIWPVFRTFYFSMTDWGDFGSYVWSGGDNYRRLVRDPAVYRAFGHTFFYVAIYIPVLVALSTFLAVLLNKGVRGSGVYRTLYFLPAVLMPAAVGLAWRWLLNGEFGLVNTLLKLVGIHGPGWLTEGRTALPAIVLVAVWSMVGFQAMILLSGLQGIPSAYYEAARQEGAGGATLFRRITLPLLTPTLFFVSVTALIQAFQVFDLIYMMIGQVAIDHADTVVYLFYKQAFQLGAKGYASAIVTALFAVILAITAIQLRLQKRWVHYD
ncbi:carbohydrate ABC transporter permease [Cohnella nanjingensis]|uniref:Sugar ABC transporter permease n=1 Tax=Cohnella nanjingensis TaxID=1387779 RepID=A0A7X0VIU9_9BACL|nr:sugar ABC transporter permease [Cohnella nanjingensis]MBB6674049.1 sugar ABC transporter permease [Cohnella nanjingensis]